MTGTDTSSAAPRRRLPPALSPARWTLRSRLVAVVVALLLATSVVVGSISTFALSSFLMNRLDTQLLAATQRSRQAFDGPSPTGQSPGGVGDGDHTDGRAPRFLLAPGQAEGTLGAVVEAQRVTRAGVLDATGSPAALPQAAYPALLQVTAGGNPQTISLPQAGAYRVVARRDPDGTELITGLPLGPVRATVYQLALVIVLVGVGGVLIAGAVGLMIIRRTLRPLDRVAATARRVTGITLDRGEVELGVRVAADDTDPRTEVGQMGAALNSLLGHVSRALAARQASETRVRQFVADASHELRTPLASIRGYAELTRRRGDDLPPEVSYAVGRVESEAVRMTGLVEDLLLLARLDSGRPTESEPVDLTGLVVDAVSDAHAAGPDHRFALRLPEEEVVVQGDGARLHQVITNLLANARTHTPAGTQVTVGLGVDIDPQGRAQAVLEVIDDGPGIPPELLPEVFERFARGDSSRARGAGSTGLGLAIVHAVVEAHSGTVTADSRPGRTCFTVRLPLAGAQGGVPTVEDECAADPIPVR